MPRKTDSGNPADWLWIAEADLALIRLGAEREVGYAAARSKLAEVLEKVAALLSVVRARVPGP